MLINVMSVRTVKSVRKAAKILAKIMPLAIALGILFGASNIPSVQAATRWQTTQGSIVPEDVKPGRFKFLSYYEVLDTVTNTKYVSTAKPTDIFNNGDGSLFASKKYWMFWPEGKEMKRKTPGGQCYGAIYVHTFKDNAVGEWRPNRPVEAEVGLVTPTPDKDDNNGCKLYDDGNPVATNGVHNTEDSNIFDEQTILKWSQFRSSDAARLATLLYWTESGKGSEIGVWGKERKLRRITGSTRDELVRLTKNSMSSAGDLTYYSATACNGDYDIPDAWVGVDWRKDGGVNRDLAMIYYKSGNKSVYEWNGEKYDCLFGRDVTQGFRLAIDGSSKTAGVGISYPEYALSQLELDQRSAELKALAIAKVLASDQTKLSICWQGTYNRKPKIGFSSGPAVSGLEYTPANSALFDIAPSVDASPTVDFQDVNNMAYSYAKIMAGVTETSDSKKLAVIDCYRSSFGAPLAEAEDADYEPERTDINGDEETSSEPEACQIQGAMGWILNPVCDIAIKSTRTLGGYIEDALKVKPLSQSTADQTDGVYEAWKVFRDLANALLVLFFLVAIFAQVLPIELDAYMVKKVLPRLIAAVIGIQASFFICQILVDISNVVGGGVDGLLTVIIERLPYAATSPSASNPASLIFVGVAGLAITVFFIGPVFMLLLAGLVSVLTMLVTIQARQVILIFLAIASPLAILAWTLPNTEQYAKKWGQNYIKLLIMYPLIAFILKGSELAYMVMSGAMTTSPDTTELSSVQQVMINFIPVIAFFMIPATFKASGAIMGAISNAGFSRANKLRSRAGASASNQLKGLKDNFQRSRAISGANKDYGELRRFGNRALSGAGLLGTMNMGKRSRYQNARRAEEGLNEEMKLISNQLTEEGLNGDNASLKAWMLERNRSKAEKIAAMRMLGENGGIEELSSIYEEMEKNNKGKPNAEWNDADRDLWQQGTINSRQALAKALPHSVRPDHNKAFGKLDSEGYASVKGAAGKAQHISKGLRDIKQDLRVASTKLRAAQLSGDKEAIAAQEEVIRNKQGQLQKAFAAMVGVGQSTDRRGRIDADVVKDWAEAVRNGELDGITLDVGGAEIDARTFVETYVTENNQLKAVPTAGARAVESGITTDEEGSD